MRRHGSVKKTATTTRGRTRLTRGRPGLFLLLMAMVTGLVSSSAAAAPTDPNANPSVPPAVKGTPVCKITDSRLSEISGLVTIGGGFAAINDSPESSAIPQLRVYFLNAQCKITSVYVDNQQPRDPEDLAVSPDGTLWVADIGDNNSGGEGRRSTVALWKIPPGEGSKRGKAQIYRMAYPDGAHDGEALLFNGDGTPIIVTKGSESGLYMPSEPLSPTSTTPLKKVGTFTPSRTGTSSGFLGIIGQGLVTAGANSPDGTKVALRTYSDAYEWDVKNGDVIAALKGAPRITPLPDEPQGESIAYSADGSTFYTVSETARLPADQKPEILRYTPAPPGQVVVQPTAAEDKRPFWDSLTISDIGYFIAGVGLLGLILVVAGVIGIRRSRKRYAAENIGVGVRPVGTVRIPQRPTGTARIADAPSTEPWWLEAPPGEPGSVSRRPEGGVRRSENDARWIEADSGQSDTGERRPGAEYRSGHGSAPNGEYRLGGEYRGRAEVGNEEIPPSARMGSGSSRGNVYGRPTRPGVARVDKRAENADSELDFSELRDPRSEHRRGFPR